MPVTIASGFIMTLMGMVGSLTVAQIMNSTNVFSIILFIVFLYILFWGLIAILISSILFVKKDKLYQSGRLADYQKALSPTKALVFGIIGLAFAVVSGAPGAFFSSIGLDKSNEYRDSGNIYSRKATVGKVLSIIGIVLSFIEVISLCVGFIVMTVAIINA